MRISTKEILTYISIFLLFLTTWGNPWINLIAGFLAISLLSLSVVLGMREFAETHAKVRNVLVDLMPIESAEHRHFGFILAIVIISSFGVTSLIILLTNNLIQDTFYARIQISVIWFVAVSTIFLVSRNFYFKERSRLNRPTSYLLFGIFLVLLVLVVEYASSFIIFSPFILVGLHWRFAKRFNRKFDRYYHQGLYTQALQYLHRGFSPPNLLYLRSRDYSKLALNYLLGNFDTLKVDAEEILQAKKRINIPLTTYQQTINFLGLSALQNGDYLMAQQYLEAALKLAAPPSNLYGSLAEIYLAQGDYPDYALKLFDSAISEASNSKHFLETPPLNLAGRAWALAMLGRSVEVDSTIATLEVDFSHNIPLFSEYYYRLGHARLAQGKTDLAIEHFQFVVDVDQEGIFGKNAREMLAQIEA